MARIIFFQRLSQEFLGPLTIATILQEQGHDVAIAVIALETGTSLRNFIQTYRPDYVAATVLTAEEDYYVDLFSHIKKSYPDIRTVVGGPHPTLVPSMIDKEGIDILCVGEGEYPMVELLGSHRKELKTEIRNLHFKVGGRIVRNEPRPYLKDIDSLPIPDYGIYYKRYPSMAFNPLKTFYLNRGCPYRCSFCSNQALGEIADGPYVRKLSPVRVVEHIRHVKERWPIEFIEFRSDSMVPDIQWVRSFYSLYKEKLRIPYLAQMNVGNYDDEVIDLMCDAGLYIVVFGLESGSERIRRDIMNKPAFSNEQFVELAKRFRKRKVMVFTHDMFVLPTETIDEAFETINLNRKNAYMGSYIFQPLPGTRILKHLPSENLQQRQGFHYGRSIIEHPHAREITNLQRLSCIIALFPDWLYDRVKPFLARLIRVPDNPLFKLAYFGCIKTIKIYCLLVCSARNKGFLGRVVRLKALQVLLGLKEKWISKPD
jgi:radical SAM superfamily enzyme YgiQ (UPF0313 family)